MIQPTPPRLHKAKAAATAAAVVATTAALTAGVASSAPEALAAHNRSVQAEVELAAATTPKVPVLPPVPDVIGVYGVGPVFWAAQLLGLTPDNVIAAAAGLLGGTEIAAAMNELLAVFDYVSPVEIGTKGPMPDDVYNAVNGLSYSLDGIDDLLRGTVSAVIGEEATGALWEPSKLLGITLWPGLKSVLEGLTETAPILNQRRAVIASESLGGLTTSMAYRDMINAVQSNDPDWGVGVTGQWLVFFNNVSRPGGGIFALATPFMEQYGLNFTTPEAGSYTNEDANGGKITKVLNTSILDISAAYSPLSDAPTTLNPLAWANAAAGGVFLTYLIPSDVEDSNIGDLILPFAGGIADGIKVMLDPTGGQGLEMLPGWSNLVKTIKAIDWLKLGLSDAIEGVADATKFPGTATYLTYDSGNLPLLEPFRMVPHLLNLNPGVHIPTPLTDSIEDALRMMVNMGYQDVDPDTLERGFDMADQQAYLWHSPLTPSQQLAANRKVFDALIDGIQANALNPEAWTPKVPGMDFKPIVQNAAAVAVMKTLRDTLELVQNSAKPMFDAAEKGLTPVATKLDDANTQLESSIDDAVKGTQAQAQSNKPAAKSNPGVQATSLVSKDAELKTLTIDTDEDKDEDKATPEVKTPARPHVTPIKDALKDLGLDKDSLRKHDLSKDIKNFTESFKPKPRHSADANDTSKRSVKETADKARGDDASGSDSTNDAKKQPRHAKKNKVGKHARSGKSTESSSAAA